MQRRGPVTSCGPPAFAFPLHSAAATHTGMARSRLSHCRNPAGCHDAPAERSIPAVFSAQVLARPAAASDRSQPIGKQRRRQTNDQTER